MLFYIFKRVLMTIPVMIVVALFVFMMLRLSPGDPAAVIAGDYATAEDVERIREQLGLSEPIVVQFTKWLGQLVQGDLGTSIFSNKPVAELIVQRIEPTMLLALSTIVFAVLVAVPLGTLAAYRAGSWVDRFVMLFSVGGFSVPVFVLGYVLIYILSLKLKWLPVQGYRSPFTEGIGPFFAHITLPTLTLSVIFIALIARMTRASVIEVLEEDYVRTARAKGQSEFKVLMRHALRNAAVPIITVIGIGIALLIGGVVVTESVYNIPGLGRLVLDAVLARDYPIIQGLILFFSFIYIVLNLLIDLSYSLLDPRIRY
ncbi:peptide/nickel transport system permease protein [Lutimaribacter pacificus]|uniref:Peptide/nickel transport system permease protein n=1 Tax=Lutimaribacter pacificus TaxID=391948 RepID=A0A1H0EUM3_9RHOB|nr:ABC transporter permease [Lutimaribacter pacificus]SDN86072.1 peptide/nickel transport system permease protein [Lutimaribacter pacificus]SHK41437.1 peptide/nickel transport system permease protein [Lutimaribacter pacificus]